MATATGGDKMKAALANLAAKLSNASVVQVGFPEGSTEADGTSIPMIAAIQEYGSAKIPPRPFMRNTVAEHSSEWPEILCTALQSNGYDAAKALGVLGEVMKNQIQQSIIDLDAPALSEVTVMLRGMRSQGRYRDMAFGNLIKEAVARVAAGKTNYGASTKPLVDSGTMLGSVVAEVS